MRRLGWMLGILLATTVACGEGTPGNRGAEAPGIRDHQFDDPEVTRIHTRMIDAMAPNQGWERTRYLAFEWSVSRPDGQPPLVRAHRWDRWEGEARVEAPTQEGGRYVALFNTSDPTAGRVWVDGEEIFGEEAQSRLEGAYRAHINDAYWLVMPYKWTDPGVVVAYQGQRLREDPDAEMDPRLWEVVELSFEEVGLTPQNRYLAWIEPETGRMERWEHFSNAEANASPANWEGWTQFGPLSLALDRTTGGQRRIFFTNVTASETVPAGAFEAPQG